MMLVQKQPNLPFSSSPATFHHRRHPSAPPAVVVQPTRTPGLLSLSKPQPPRTQHRSPRPPPPKSTAPKQQASTMPATPSPAPRGRQTKDRSIPAASRSTSISARRPALRQPSPQQQQPPATLDSSQAEGPTTPTQSNTSDPFLDSIKHQSSANVSSAAPTLAVHPSGKLARRRQQPKPIPPFVPKQPRSKPIPVPIPVAKAIKPLSRSVPLPTRTTARARPIPKRSSALLPAWGDDFPICDDISEAGDVSDTDASPPVTPTRSHARGFPFATPPVTPTFATSSTRARSHRRAPSEGAELLFNMSSDEDTSGLDLDRHRRQEVKALFGLVRTAEARRRESSSPPASASLSPCTPNTMRERQLEREAHQSQQAGYFASSMFQNSPSPDELPDPLFA